MQRSHVSTRAGSESPQSTSAFDSADGNGATNEFSEFVDHMKAAAEQGSAHLAKTIRENPTLALAGLVAIGAVAGLALRHRAQNRSLSHRLGRDAVKQTRALRSAIRQELRDSGLEQRYGQLNSQLQSTLGNMDWKPYVQPIIEKFASALDQARTSITPKS